MAIHWSIENKLFCRDAVARVHAIRKRIRTLAAVRYPPRPNEGIDGLRDALCRKGEQTVLSNVVRDILGTATRNYDSILRYWIRACAHSRTPKAGGEPLTFFIDYGAMFVLVNDLKPITKRAKRIGCDEPELLFLQLALLEIPDAEVENFVDASLAPLPDFKGVIECLPKTSLPQPSPSA